MQQKGKPPRFIEVKLSDGEPSRSFAQTLNNKDDRSEKIQLVLNLDREFTSKQGVRICSALDYLASIKFD